MEAVSLDISLIAKSLQYIADSNTLCGIVDELERIGDCLNDICDKLDYLNDKLEELNHGRN